MKKIALLTALALLAMALTSALAASVRTTGDVNVRTGPGLDYEILLSVASGNVLPYAGETSTDGRGVDWYSVDIYGQTGWISSKYSALEGDPAAPAAGPLVEVPEPFASWIELSPYYLTDSESAASALGLGEAIPVDGELGYMYRKDGVTLGGYQDVVFMEIADEGYTLCGVGVGMEADLAATLMQQAGMVYEPQYSGPDALLFQRPTDQVEYMAGEAYEGNVLLTLQNDRVIEISWDTYTG